MVLYSLLMIYPEAIGYSYMMVLRTIYYSGSAFTITLTLEKNNYTVATLYLQTKSLADYKTHIFMPQQEFYKTSYQNSSRTYEAKFSELS